MSKKTSIMGMAFGIASVVLAFNGSYSFGIAAVAGLVCAILGMNFSKKAVAEVGENGFNKAGKITSLIGLIASIVFFGIGLGCGICACIAGVAGNLSY